MTEGYTKLFNSILLSSIWQQDDATRVVWITMLALANRHGVVGVSVPGLAHVARVEVTKCVKALETLSSPDGFSRSEEREGRRIEKVERGWQIVNYAKFRELGRSQERTDYLREKQRESRKRRQPLSTNVNRSQPIADADADAESKDNKSTKNNVGKLNFPNGLTDSEWLARLAQDKTYEGIDVIQEHGKMVNWCNTNQKSPTRRRFINWLNRTERPMQLVVKAKRKESLW